MLKYPRTPHLEGSRLQPGDSAKDQISFSEIKGLNVIVEEKIDGANTGISFSRDGDLRLQSRGHFLDGGARERQFNLFKSWATRHEEALLERIEDRYIVFGEYAFAKHTVFYDRLPHYFLEFDIYDRSEETYLSTERRRALLSGLPIVSVPVLAEGSFAKLSDITDLVQPSLYKGEAWREELCLAAERAGVDPARALAETESSNLSEGLYLKVEQDGEVISRMKWIRRDFLQTILDSGSHWQDRPIIRNGLASNVDIYADARLETTVATR